VETADGAALAGAAVGVARGAGEPESENAGAKAPAAHKKRKAPP